MEKGKFHHYSDSSYTDVCTKCNKRDCHHRRSSDTSRSESCDKCGRHKDKCGCRKDKCGCKRHGCRSCWKCCTCYRDHCGNTLSYALIKTANPAFYSNAGDIVTFYYEFKNMGTGVLSGTLILKDDRVGEKNLGNVVIPVGSSLYFNFPYVITATDAMQPFLSNFSTGELYLTGKYVILLSNGAVATVTKV